MAQETTYKCDRCNKTVGGQHQLSSNLTLNNVTLPGNVAGVHTMIVPFPFRNEDDRTLMATATMKPGDSHVTEGELCDNCIQEITILTCREWIGRAQQKLTDYIQKDIDNANAKKAQETPSND